LKGKIPIVGGNILTDEDVLRSMQDEALGIITSHTYAASYDRPQNKAFVEAFRKAYSREPSYYAESMYTAAMWLDRFPDPRVPTHEATVVLTGHDPNERRVQWIPQHHAPGTARAPAHV
jgi:hypothetical protein